MYTAWLLATLLGFVCQAVPGVKASFIGHELDIEAWSEATDMESLKYHWIDGTTNSILDKQAHYRSRQALGSQDNKMQRILNRMQNTLLRDEESKAAAFMVCENTVKYCDLYEHLNICNFTQWQDICVKTCDKEFNCEEGEVESCGVVENITEEFKEAFIAAINDNPDHFNNPVKEVEQALAYFEELGDTPPSWTR